MSLTFLATIVLTGAITIFVIVASAVLVVHKNSSRRTQAIMRRRKEFYSRFVTEFLTAEVADRDMSLPASEHFEEFEKLLRPLKRSMERMSRGTREEHRMALMDVLLDFAKDLSGEAGERIVFLAYSFNFVDELIQRLTSRRWWVRAHAARDLGHLGVKRATAALTQALEDENAEVRFEAIQSLVKLVGVEAFRTIFRAGRNLSTWNMMALSVIVLRFKEDAIEFLLEGLEAKDQSVVVFCIEMLAEIGFISAVDPLRRVAESYPNVVVRTKAIEALGRLGDARSVPLLVAGIGNTYPRMRIAALNALRRIGPPSAIPRLKERLNDGDLEEKLAAARALAACGEEGLDMLRRVAGSTSDLQRRVAAQVLEESGFIAMERSHA